ncbi:MAG: hypothetical protein IPK14_18305 [Blastocatellia bacterium]|nr:hypothetical protein [Blastocatellia bacterium]MBL8194483.1 hypothetical protein [Blastocatellia bacterium]
MDQSKLKPALISGVIFGIISVIPLVGALNCVCCAWLLVCGIVAVKMFISNNPSPVSSSEGATVGALAGAVAGIISNMVSWTINIVKMRGASTEQIRQEFEKALSQQPNLTAEQYDQVIKIMDIILGSLPLFIILFFLVGVIIMTIFGALGGVIGVKIFNKGKTPPPNVPYGQSFGEGPKSSYPINQ